MAGSGESFSGRVQEFLFLLVGDLGLGEEPVGSDLLHLPVEQGVVGAVGGGGVVGQASSDPGFLAGSGFTFARHAFQEPFVSFGGGSSVLEAWDEPCEFLVGAGYLVEHFLNQWGASFLMFLVKWGS